jgi:pyrophosphatase PpaX
MKYRYLLFDLDGTLIDTNELILRSFEHALEVHAPGRYTRADILPHMGEPLWQQMNTFVPGQEDVAVQTYRAYNIEQHDALVTAFEHVGDVLRRLKADGCILGVVTSKMRLTARMGVELTGLADLFDAFVTMDDTEKHKPDPEPVLLAMEQLGAVPEETIMVGDSPYDILAGQAANVTSFGVAWSLRGAEGLAPFKPDYLVSDMLELEAIIRGEKGQD